MSRGKDRRHKNEGRDDEFRVDRFTDFAPGMPLDPDAIPEVRYQVLEGRVHLLQRWKDGTTLRGEIELRTLENLVGAPPQEGWYNALGHYLGANAQLDSNWPKD